MEMSTCHLTLCRDACRLIFLRCYGRLINESSIEINLQKKSGIERSFLTGAGSVRTAMPGGRRRRAPGGRAGAATVGSRARRTGTPCAASGTGPAPAAWASPPWSSPAAPPRQIGRAHV